MFGSDLVLQFLMLKKICSDSTIIYSPCPEFEFSTFHLLLKNKSSFGKICIEVCSPAMPHLETSKLQIIGCYETYLFYAFSKF